MKVTYVGQNIRRNAYGTFEPGKTYDVSDEVGKQLLTVPAMFIEKGKMQQAGTAAAQVVEVDDEETVAADDGYDDMKNKDLENLVRERGLPLRRGARKAELIQILRDDDESENADNDDTE